LNSPVSIARFLKTTVVDMNLYLEKSVVVLYLVSEQREKTQNFSDPVLSTIFERNK
jgi:hypothetical protein